MRPEPTLLVGRAALDHAGSARFQAQWQALYDSCPWATACQHPDFVLPWYRLYQPQYVPVLVFETAADGALLGLLPLALHEDGRRLGGAGDQQAEYQGWLLAPGADGGFVVRAVRSLQARFAHADLCLKYLPAGIALGGLDATGELGSNCVWRRHRRPLMTIEAGAMERQRSKKNHRQNANRLRRSGELRFERVTDHAHFARLFGDMCRQYDFRQAALYRAMPFATDAAKRPFCLELHRRGLLHATVLTVGQDIAAAHLGLLSAGRAVHLGINTHDPAWAAHSPGNLLLAMLGVQLVQDKLPLLDLTPGGDGYKEHFASGHDDVLELCIYSNAIRRWRAHLLQRAAQAAKARLRQAGLDPARLRAWRMRFKEGPRAAVRSWLAGRGPASTPAVLHHAGPRQRGAGGLRIARNCLPDILKFDAQGSAARYGEFLNTVMKRMERCHHLYTFIQDGVLAMSCWASTDQAKAPAAAQAGAPPAPNIVLSDLYVHRQCEGSALVQGFIDALVQAVGPDHEGQVIYRGVLGAQLKAALERCGFVDATRQASG